MTAQNIYDRADFFTAYSALRRQVEGLAGAPEWPVLRALIGEVEGARVVDLGCGFGWFCRWARQAGAASALGLDLSENMLARARKETDDPAIEFRCADLDAVTLPRAVFDLVYSSLALHYVADFPRLAREISAGLKPGGRMVCSLEHPVFMAPTAPGWIERPGGKRVWPLDAYAQEGERVTDWLAPGVRKQHRMLGTTLNSLIAAGLTIAHVEEWAPSEADIAAYPEMAGERERPLFLIIAASKAAERALQSTLASS